MSFEIESRQERDKRVIAENRAIGGVFKFVLFIFAASLIPLYALYKLRASKISLMDREDPKAVGDINLIGLLTLGVYPAISLFMAGFFTFTSDGAKTGSTALLFALPVVFAWLAAAKYMTAKNFVVYRVTRIVKDAFKVATTPSSSGFKLLVGTVPAQIVILIMGATASVLPIAWVIVMLAGLPFAFSLAKAQNELAEAGAEEDRQNARLLAICLGGLRADQVAQIYIHTEGSREAGTFYLRTGEIPTELVSYLDRLNEVLPKQAPDLEVVQADHHKVILQSASEETLAKRKLMADSDGLISEATEVKPEPAGTSDDWDF